MIPALIAALSRVGAAAASTGGATAARAAAASAGDSALSNVLGGMKVSHESGLASLARNNPSGNQVLARYANANPGISQDALNSLTGGGGSGGKGGGGGPPDAGQQFGGELADRIRGRATGKLDGMLSGAIDKAMNFQENFWNNVKAAPSEGVQNARRVIQDDYLGLFAQVLPDSAKRFVGELNALTQSIVGRGRELSRWSGPLAESGARADVRRMQSEQYEARTAGRQYARVIDESSRLENNMRDNFAPLKEAIAGALADVLKALNNVLDQLPIKEIAFAAGEVIRMAAKVLTFDVAGAIELLETMPARFIEALTDGSKDPFGGDFIDETIKEMQRERRKEEAAPGRPFPANGGRFGFPAVAGL